MEYDLVVIGAGAAGEAAATTGAEMGSRVAIIEKELVGGECSFWACIPSKSLLDSAHRRVSGADYSWGRASDRRDWNISRENTDRSSDEGHVETLEQAGAVVIRGIGRIAGAGKIEVKEKTSRLMTIEFHSLVVATGSTPVIPPIEGLTASGYWTNREGTSTRDLPSSVVILGGGPVGVEMAQVYARFGVKTVLVEGNDRILVRDHPRSSFAVAEQMANEGVDIRLGARAERVDRSGKGRVVTLSDGSKVEGAEIVVAVGRKPSDLRSLGLEELSIDLDARGSARHDEEMRMAPGVFVAGDAAGGMQFTHVADYQGRIAAWNALGRSTVADMLSVPRCTFTDPETGAVGLTVEEAQAAGIDAFEVTQNFASTARGNTIEGSHGHVTAVIDSDRRRLVGAFAACPAASELIHEAVLALKLRASIDVLADTIHAFPTGARVFGNLMSAALKRLAS